MGGYCGDVFSAMTDLCKDADYKPEVAKQIKGARCIFDAKAKKASASLKKGIVEFRFNWDTANHADVVREYLENNL